MLAHNKLTMNSGFDFDLLNIELEGITDIDMSDFGFEDLGGEFDESALDDLFADAPAKEKEPKTMKCPHCGEIIEL
jgi:hypothetical protein